MPIKEIKKNGKLVGYKWGNSGKLYTISKYGKNEAYKKATEQAKAIYARGYKK